jgi:hypothetical protein
MVQPDDLSDLSHLRAVSDLSLVDGAPDAGPREALA